MTISLNRGTRYSDFQFFDECESGLNTDESIDIYILPLHG